MKATGIIKAPGVPAHRRSDAWVLWVGQLQGRCPGAERCRAREQARPCQEVMGEAVCWAAWGPVENAGPPQIQHLLLDCTRCEAACSQDPAINWKSYLLGCNNGAYGQLGVQACCEHWVLWHLLRKGYQLSQDVCMGGTYASGPMQQKAKSS